MARGWGGHPGRVPGASDSTRRVTHVNANWIPPATGEGDGDFELMVVTEDDRRHSFGVSAAAATAIMSACTPDRVLLWDDAGRTLIVANVLGEWVPPDWSAGT